MAASAMLSPFVAGFAAPRGRALPPVFSLPKRAGRVSLVRCLAKEKAPQEPPTVSTTLKSKESASFFDILAFSGPGPERINGRLAMIGFMSAMAVELASGNDLVAQVSHGGLPWFAGTAALLTAASLVPLFKGVSAQSKSGGVMTANAELWNGRFAMLGLVALAFTEYLKGGPLI